MFEIERYQWSATSSGGAMQWNPNGSWCKYTAAKKLIAENLWLNAEIARLESKVKELHDQLFHMQVKDI